MIDTEKKPRWEPIEQAIIAVYAVTIKGKEAATALDNAIESITKTLSVERLIDIKDHEGNPRWETIDQAIIAVYAVAMKGKESATALDRAIESKTKTLRV